MMRLRLTPYRRFRSAHVARLHYPLGPQGKVGNPLQEEVNTLYNRIREKNEAIKALEIDIEGLHKQLATADEEIKKLKADVAIGGEIIVGVRCMVLGTSLALFSYALWDGSTDSIMIIAAIWLFIGWFII